MLSKDPALVVTRRMAGARIIAWHILTALGDARWRTEPGVAMPGGGSATTYVDRLNMLLSELDLS